MTDADPPITRGATWNEDNPERVGTVLKLSDRTTKLLNIFSGQQTVKVFHSQITLEYDLANAGDENATAMATVWEGCFVGRPGTFNSAKVVAAGFSRDAKAMAAWRGICLAGHSGSKAEFAHRLAAKLVEKDKNDNWVLAFDVPDYLKAAVTHVVASCNQPAKVLETSAK